MMRHLDQLQQWLQAKKTDSSYHEMKGLRIDKVYSPIDYLKIQSSDFSLLSDGAIEGFFTQLERQHLIRFLSPDHTLLQITLRMKASGSTSYIQLRDQLDSYLKKELPEIKVRYTGSGILASESANSIARGQIQSVLLAFGLVFVILSIFFLSIRMGVVALYPNMVSTLIFFGLLGWCSIPIGVTISVIASIAIGIGIDDTIHFLSHFTNNVKKWRDDRKAAQITIEQIGRPVLFTAISLGSGFIVFTVSEMESQVLFGSLLAFTLAVCLIAGMTFLPSLVVETKVITAWDYLALQFTKDFLKGIPLFQDMTVRETKIATLMAYTDDLESGTVLFHENEMGHEMFMILEGKISLYLESEFHGHRHELVNLSKGATFGEMGLFRKSKRAASAQAIEPTQLLIMNEKTLVRLKRRYPQIAAKIFLNLAKSLTESIQRTSITLSQNITVLSSVETPSDSESRAEEPLPLFAGLFHQMNPRQVIRFQQYGSSKTVATGDYLFHQGAPADSFAIVTTGELIAQLEAPDGPLEIRQFASNDGLGESALLSQNALRMASVIAKKDSEVWLITPQNLQSLIQQEKKIAAIFTHNLVCMLSTRLEKTNRRTYQ